MTPEAQRHCMIILTHTLMLIYVSIDTHSQTHTHIYISLSGEEFAPYEYMVKQSKKWLHKK